MSMVEDALKSTRTVHRLILSVSALTLVFAFSLRLPADKVEQLRAIESILGFPFDNYDTLAEEAIDNAASETLQPIADRLEQELEALGHPILNTHHIAEAFAAPVHVGRLRVSDTVLVQTSDASLNQLAALTVLDSGRDIQLLVPNVEGLVASIDTFLRQHGRAGQRVDGVRLTLGNAPFFDTDFLAVGELTATLYFELVETVTMGGVPVYSSSFVCRVTELPETSFEGWLASTGGGSLAERVGDGLVWLPELDEHPQGFREEKLGLLHRELTDEIEEAGPERRSLAILGASIPGILVVYAAPTVLLVLSHYLLGHVRHLSRLSAGHRDEFRDFVWMPLAQRRTGLVELVVTSGAAPSLATAALLWKLDAIGGIAWLPTLTLVVAIVGVPVYCAFVFAEVRSIRAAFV